MLVFLLCLSLGACSSGSNSAAADKTDEMKAIEEALDLANMNSEWTYSEDSDAWTLSVVTAV